MYNDTEFYRCEHCGNIVGMVYSSGVPLICCGKKMQKLVSTLEQHLPKVSVHGNIVAADIGGTPHPMTDEHLIEWVYLKTTSAGQRKNLKPGDAPQVKFALTDDEPVAVYAYCNLHGLWKIELK